MPWPSDAGLPGLKAVVELQGLAHHLALGLLLAGFMASFDIAFGKLVMRLKWARIWQDFNPANGNFLSLGLLALCGLPAVVWWVSGP